MLSHVAQADPAMSGQLDYERREADFYATPTENVDCLHLVEPLTGTVWWEPACGEGHIAKRVIELCGAQMVSTDLHDRGYGKAGFDFLLTKSPPVVAVSQKPGDYVSCNGIITNPPFGDLAEEFIRHALELMKPVNGRVIMFLRNEYDCGKERRALFSQYPFAHKIVVTKRPRWIEGSKGSPRHSYAWFVWDFSIPQDQGAYISYVHPEDCPTLRKQKASK